MKFYHSLILVALLVVNCYGAPHELNNMDDEYPELNSGYFEGDMIVDLQRNGVISESKRWPDGVVHYKMGPEYDDEHADFIIDAMKAIENVSCISFKPATENITAYLNITSRESGCSAVVGYVNTNQQFNIRIGKLHSGCFVKGTIIHELLHALGFFHQHNSPNRDDYIKIVEENVKDGYMSKFNKNKDKDVTDFGVGYDYGSVMHYPAKAYSKNGKDTLIPLEDEKIEIGQRRGLSDKDIEKLNLMYECKKD